MNKCVPPPADDEAVVLQVRKIGNSVGLILPKELLVRFRLKEGDKLHVIEQPERSLKLSPYDEAHARAMTAARKIMKKYSNALRTLAK